MHLMTILRSIEDEGNSDHEVQSSSSSGDSDSEGSYKHFRTSSESGSLSDDEDPEVNQIVQHDDGEFPNQQGQSRADLLKEQMRQMSKFQELGNEAVENTIKEWRHKQKQKKQTDKAGKSAGMSTHELVTFETPHNQGKHKANVPEKIKSPSDTTLYNPALKRAACADDIIDKISNFVESIRIESEMGREGNTRRDGTPGASVRAGGASEVQHPQPSTSEAATKKRTDCLIVQVKQN